MFPHLTVLGNAILGLELTRNRWWGRLGEAARRQAIEQGAAMLDAVGLGHVKDAMPVALGRDAAAPGDRPGADPARLLLLDEPFGLDPGIRADMHVLVKRLWRQTGMTVFMVTHDLKEAFALGTRVLTFDKIRRDPQAPEAYGATITYDIPGYNRPREEAHAPPPDHRHLPHQPGRAPLASRASTS